MRQVRLELDQGSLKELWCLGRLNWVTPGAAIWHKAEAGQVEAVHLKWCWDITCQKTAVFPCVDEQVSGYDPDFRETKTTIWPHT